MPLLLFMLLSSAFAFPLSLPCVVVVVAVVVVVVVVGGVVVVVVVAVVVNLLLLRWLLSKSSLPLCGRSPRGCAAAPPSPLLLNLQVGLALLMFPLPWLSAESSLLALS